MAKSVARQLYEEFAAAVAYVCVKTPNGDEGIGTAFHIGQNVWVSARHVLENNVIIEIATTEKTLVPNDESTESGGTTYRTEFYPGKARSIRGPYFHPDPTVDVAVIVLEGITAPVIPLGDHLDDWLGTELVLCEVVVMGYPPIPYSQNPTLVATRAEVNAIVDKYTGGHPHFIVSAMARGGFSGGPVICEYGFTLGVVTESLMLNHPITELGYMSVLTVEPIYACLAHHNLIPDDIDKDWDGFWNTTSFDYADSNLYCYRGHMGKGIKIYCKDKGLLSHALNIAVSNLEPESYRIEVLHDSMKEVWFDKDFPEDDFSGRLERIKTHLEGLWVGPLPF